MDRNKDEDNINDIQENRHVKIHVESRETSSHRQ